MSRRRFRAWFVIPCAALSLALAGCGGASGSASTATPKQSPVSVDVAPVQAATSITDVRGQRISVARKPERVVCLVALCDDMLLELGMRPVATSSTILEHPGFLGKDAAQVPKIPGGFLSPDAEAIVKAEPDLVIGLAQTHEQLAANLKGIAPLWLLAPRSWEESIRYLRDLAALTDRGEQAVAAEKRFREKLAAAEARAPKDRTALVIYGSDKNFQVDSAGSIVGGLLARVARYPWEDRGTGGHQAGGSTYSMEEIITRNPDVIFVETMAFGPNPTPLSRQLAENPLWKRIKAVEEGRVYEVNADVWGKGRGTRSLGIVLDDAMKLLYPAR
ncbi:iron ABC transporter substrate-binding protein [Carbonactinospora thermoautotrophica]|uniref:Iron ABC transporter substrate-binding protein n=1 Tax=Carbonactinospora thermoautotrophica TaxID=1469144 RepID=A0A132N3J9_9ACTN|nr:iron ABC transporter substrate-binding protein [Carbonactinospora thermoautotrophica]KWX08547.1 iron ABC transporter substrate-binding protein [Carbonactinospora thermoautotrophica]